jgi:lysine 2,3-aminomutase
VNDSVEALAELFGRQSELGVSPYYLFHLDPAAGTAHFRVSLKRGLALMREVAERHPRLVLPIYALDLPGGGGKAPVANLTLVEDDGKHHHGGCITVRDIKGTEYRYPV